MYCTSYPQVIQNRICKTGLPGIALKPKKIKKRCSFCGENRIIICCIMSYEEYPQKIKKLINLNASGKKKLLSFRESYPQVVNSSCFKMKRHSEKINGVRLSQENLPVVVNCKYGFAL